MPAAAAELVSPRLGAEQLRALMRPMELDLQAAYSAARGDVMALVDQAVREGWTPERLIAEVEAMWDEEIEAEDLVGKALPEVRFQGLPIKIENRPGSLREGVDADGHPWSTRMKAPYGFIRGTKGADGDEVDVFLGPDILSPWVYVLHMAGLDDETYDEDKVVLGCTDLDQATNLALSHYDRPMKIEPEMFHLEDFKRRLQTDEGEAIGGGKVLMLLEAQKAGVHRGLVRKAMELVDLYVAKAEAPIGSTRNWGGWLFVRVAVGTGKWTDWKKLGKAPSGWESGDPVPEQFAGMVTPEALEAAAHQVKPTKKPKPEKKPAGGFNVAAKITEIGSSSNWDQAVEKLKGLSVDELKQMAAVLAEGTSTWNQEYQKMLLDKVNEKLLSTAPEEGKTFYHGTTAADFDKFKAGLAYLTLGQTPAEGFAADPMAAGHAGPEGGKPKVLKITAKPGKTKDIDAAIEAGIDEGKDPDEVIQGMKEQLDAEGVHYVTFTHPGVGASDDFLATVSLHPDEDLVIEASKGLGAEEWTSKKKSVAQVVDELKEAKGASEFEKIMAPYDSEFTLKVAADLKEQGLEGYATGLEQIAEMKKQHEPAGAGKTLADLWDDYKHVLQTFDGYEAKKNALVATMSKEDLEKLLDYAKYHGLGTKLIAAALSQAKKTKPKTYAGPGGKKMTVPEDEPGTEEGEPGEPKTIYDEIATDMGNSKPGDTMPGLVAQVMEKHPELSDDAIDAIAAEAHAAGLENTVQEILKYKGKQHEAAVHLPKQLTSYGDIPSPADGGYFTKAMAKHLAQSAEELTQLEAVEELANLGGSTGGGARRIKYKDPTHGEVEAVLKTGASPGQIREEVLADAIYELCGAFSKRSVLVRDENGNMASRSNFLAGYKLLGMLSPAEKKKAVDKLKQHFVVDAFLGNWDVTGADGDNVMVSGVGDVVRIDNGGALRYRAQGALKEAAFGKKVVELDSMRDPNKLAGQIYSSVTDAEVQKQVKELLKHKEHILALAPEELRDTLRGRLEYLRKWKPEGVAAAEKPKKVKLQTKEGTTGMQVPVPDQKMSAAIHHYKGNGYVSMNEWLRAYENTKGEAAVADRIKQMDAYLDQCPWQPVDVWRGSKDVMLADLLKGLAFPKFSLAQKGDLLKKGPEGFPTFLDYMKDWLVGIKFGDNGFVSTSTSRSTAEGFAGSAKLNSTEGGAVILHITGKAKCFSMYDAIGSHSEAEWVLNRGTRYKITDVKMFEGGHTYLQFDVQVLGSPEESPPAQAKQEVA